MFFFQCIEKMSHANCPVCQEDLHTSREPCQIPPCHHLLHKSCFDRLLANSHFYCPICYGSLMDLSPIWKLYKKQIQNNPMPERYQVLKPSQNKKGQKKFQVHRFWCPFLLQLAAEKKTPKTVHLENVLTLLILKWLYI